ncbi:hypothetical protein [Vibrio lentus]|uniref:hypothetical protein n=1 Tax=Vibrio lentus TaxID=136468 RepID=UPI000C825A7A|nr:hypothetical protein [Vibrio lentus]PMG80719.1 hypothetical protein BCU86_00575 [Vibrio lentus]
MVKFLYKIVTYLVSMVKYLFFSTRKLDSNSSYLSDNSKIIVSLTTYDKRISQVHLTIKTILLQSSPPKKIYLWLSYDDLINCEVPSCLKDLERFGVKIKFVDENIRSYKKIIYTYEEEKGNLDCYIVTADDDIFYPRSWLSGFERKILENPNDVYCYRAQEISFFSNSEVNDYTQWSLYHSESSVSNVLATGVSGICYPMESLRGVEDRKFLDISPSADDIWLKFITLRNGYNNSLVLNRSVHFSPVIKPFTIPSKGLEEENIFNNGNTKVFNKCLDFFKLSKRDFTS